jgi:hypothetical protein
MLGRNIFRIGLWIILAGIPSVEAQSVRSHGGSFHGSHGFAGRGRPHGQGWPIFMGFGPSGMYAPFPPILFVGPSMFFPAGDWMMGQPMMGGGPLQQSAGRGETQ